MAWRWRGCWMIPLLGPAVDLVGDCCSVEVPRSRVLHLTQPRVCGYFEQGLTSRVQNAGSLLSSLLLFVCARSSNTASLLCHALGRVRNPVDQAQPCPWGSGQPIVLTRTLCRQLECPHHPCEPHADTAAHQALSLVWIICS